MKAIRYTLYGLLGLITLIVIAAAVFILTFDPKQYKGDVERLVKEQTGRTLVLSDDIQMSLYPKLGVKIGPTTLTEKDGKATFVSVESAQVSVALLPLIKRQILVDGINLDGLVAHIARDKNGSFNFDDFLSKTAAVEPVESVEITSKDGQATNVTFDVGGITLVNATITYVDHATQQRIDIKALDLSTGQIAMQASGDVKLSAQVEAPALPINAKVTLAGQYALDIAQQTLALNNLALGLNGYAAQVQNLNLTAKTSLQANLAIPRIDLKSIEIDAAAKDLFKASLRSAGLIWNNDAFTLQQFNLTANVDQPKQKFGVQFQAPEITGSTARIAIAKFTSTVLVDMPDVLRQAMKIPVQGNLNFDLAKQSLQTTFAATVDDSKVNATVNLPRLSPLATRAQISIDRIDLDRYLAKPAAAPAPAAAANTAAPATSAAKPAASSSEIDLGALQSLDLQARVEIGKIKAKGLTLDDFKTDISAAKGLLRVGPHSANMSAGTIKGEISINAQNNQFRISETLSGIAVARLLKELGQDSRIEGTANLNMNLATQGKNTSSLVPNLSGTAQFNVADGAIRGVDIARLLRSIQGVITTGRLPEFSPEDKTVFSELNGSLNIKQGVATNNDLMMKAPIFRVQGQGEVNLVTTHVNYQARLAVVETTQGQGGPEIEALRGVTIPVRLTGPFDNISYQIDIASLAAEIAKTRAGQAVGDKIEKAIGPETTERVEKLLGPDLTNKLKGLFGR